MRKLQKPYICKYYSRFFSLVFKMRQTLKTVWFEAVLYSLILEETIKKIEKSRKTKHFFSKLNRPYVKFVNTADGTLSKYFQFSQEEKIQKKCKW